MPDDDDDDDVADDQSPVQKLKELLKKQEELEAQTKALKAQGDALTAQIDVLKSAVTELEKAGRAFGSAVTALGPEIEERKAYLKTKTQMVEVVLGAKKDTVIHAIEEVDKKIGYAKTELTTANGAAKEAERASESSKKVVEEKKKAYQDIKDLAQTLGRNVGDLNNFITKIEQFDDQRKPANMYVYLLEMDALMKKTAVQSNQDYLRDLNKARKELDVANETAAEKKRELDAAKDNAAIEETEYADLKKKRVDDILEKVKDLNA